MPAPKGNKYAEGNTGGRPTEYKPEYNNEAYQLCLMGATDADMAEFFDVCEKTINSWKLKHKDFLQSIRAGKKVADMNVAHSLYKSTGDREVSEQKAVKLKEVYWDENGRRCERESVQIVTETRIVPADFRSQSLWLRNRVGDKWNDTQKIELPGNTIVNLGSGVEPENE